MDYIKENLSTIIILVILIVYLLYQRIPLYLNNSKLENTRLREDLILVDLKNQEYHLSEIKDKTIVINFWATWCLPCKVEMPLLESTYQDLKSDGLEIFGITSEDQSLVENYLKNHPVSYPIVIDKNYALTNYFNIQGYPTIIIIKNQQIVDVATGLNVFLKYKIRWYTKKSLF
jgi:thiol-disulfide isomerase/thioredoxin